MITASPSDITLPHLRHLHLGAQTHLSLRDHPPSYSPALTGVTQHFEIDISTRKQPFAALISLIRRSRCRLTKVEIVQKFMFGDLHPHYPDDMEALLELYQTSRHSGSADHSNALRTASPHVPYCGISSRLGGRTKAMVVPFSREPSSTIMCQQALQDDFFKEGARLHEIQERLKMKQRKINM
ncbi:hypothetical protein Hypma_005178 [Hypsizygus marmoreus]|uniref:Uncharacterized protein n=1 Tax=Hypsizygus marmoreus TaxID=39966 RepID=A0A369J3C9_HYPMA|nr:hypothetical protein Hypma_005178 [Hypsizygus marmoreus]